MRIDLKMLSIPPFLSTSWDKISSLHVERRELRAILIVTLNNGSRIEIPNLPDEVLKNVFTTHSQVLELENNHPEQNSQRLPFRQPNLFTGEGQGEGILPFKIGIEGLDGMGAALQHNPDQADSPDLPPEILKKIAAISKAIGVDDALLPKPEPHCNCMHCQVAKAICTGAAGEEIIDDQEEVDVNELTFREWDIEQTGNKLYLVTNPLDQKEHYTVFLGEPLGCTCGEKNCPHIVAVLNS